jgi:hypothetical protein
VTLIDHPTPAELLEGMARALTATVAPELSSDYARSQLGTAVGLLRYLGAQVDGAAQELIDEHREFERALATASPALTAGGHEDAAARLAAVLAGSPGDVRLSTLQRRSEALRQTLLDVLLLAAPAAESGDLALGRARDAAAEALDRANARRLRA